MTWLDVFSLDLIFHIGQSVRPSWAMSLKRKQPATGEPPMRTKWNCDCSFIVEFYCRHFFSQYQVHIFTLDCAYFSIYIRLCIFQHSIQKKTTNICLALCTGTPHDHSKRVLPWEITLCDNDHYWLLMFRLEQVSCRIVPDGPEYSSTWDMRNLWRKPPVIGPDLWNLAILLMIRNPAPVEVGGLSHYLQGFIHPNGGCLGFLNH